MDAKVLLKLIGNDQLTEDDAEILLQRAVRLAINHRWWGENDKPTEEEIGQFIDRYEFEIYDIAKSIQSDSDHDGEIQHTELGITRVWGKTDAQTLVAKALGAIPPKTYVWGN